MNCLALALAVVLAAQDPEADRLRKELDKVKADHAQVLKQLEARIQELNDRLARAQSEKKPAERSVQKAAAEALEAVLERDARALEERYKVTMPAVATPAPVYLHFTYQGKVTAVANEIGLVVISIGKDDGVAEGQEFMILRSGETIGTLTVDRADRKWAAGKISQKQKDPRVGDEVLLQKAVMRQSIPAVPGTPAPAPLTPNSAEELRSLRKELDEVRSQVRQLSDRIVPSWQGAGVSVEEASDELRAHLAILRGLLVRRVKEGSPAERAGLKANDVVPDLLEAQLLQAIEMGMPIHVVRQGQRMRLPGAMGK